MAIYPGSLGTEEGEKRHGTSAEERLRISYARQCQARIAAYIEILVA